MPLESNFCLQLRKVKGESLETSLFLSPSCVQSNSWVFCCFVLQPSLAVHCTSCTCWECGKGKRKKQERKEKVRWERQDRHETSSSVTNVVATGNASFEREGSWAREEGIWGELCRINYQKTSCLFLFRPHMNSQHIGEITVAWLLSIFFNIFMLIWTVTQTEKRCFCHLICVAEDRNKGLFWWLLCGLHLSHETSADTSNGFEQKDTHSCLPDDLYKLCVR